MDHVENMTAAQLEDHFRHTHNQAYDAQRGKRLVLDLIDPLRRTCTNLHNGMERQSAKIALLEKENAELRDKLNRKEITRP